MKFMVVTHIHTEITDKMNQTKISKIIFSFESYHFLCTFKFSSFCLKHRKLTIIDHHLLCISVGSPKTVLYFQHSIYAMLMLTITVINESFFAHNGYKVEVEFDLCIFGDLRGHFHERISFVGEIDQISVIPR